VSTAAERLSRHQGLIQPLLLDKATVQHLAPVLEDAANTAARLINDNLLRMDLLSGRVTAARLRLALTGLGDLAAGLWDEVGATTKAGIHAAAHLAVDQQLDIDWLMGMPGGAVLQYAESAHLFATQSARDIISRGINNIPLADHIYKGGKRTVAKVGRIVERGLALQSNAREIAKQVRDHFHPKVPGGTNYASMRLARTEINNAHHTTTIRNMQDRPWIKSVKWNLSESHPKPDACDDYARRTFQPGNVPRKPHPQCFCYLTQVVPDTEEFLNNLTSGVYDSWLRSRGVKA